MKQIIYSIVFCSLATFVSGQVAIGKENIDGNSALLDFASGTTKGIILPAVDAAPVTLSVQNNGTLLFDKTDKKVKMWENGSYVELSDEGDSSEIVTNTSSEIGEGVIIGTETSNAVGVLILESTDKALILPRVINPHLNIKSPYPGTICYDIASKTLAVFDGSAWHFWK